MRAAAPRGSRSQQDPAFTRARAPRARPRAAGCVRPGSARAARRPRARADRPRPLKTKRTKTQDSGPGRPGSPQVRVCAPTCAGRARAGRGSLRRPHARGERRDREPGQARRRSEAGSQQAEATRPRSASAGQANEVQAREAKRADQESTSQGVKLSKPRKGRVPKAKCKSVRKRRKSQANLRAPLCRPRAKGQGGSESQNNCQNGTPGRVGRSR